MPTPAQRQKAYRQRLKAGAIPTIVRIKKPVDRRSRPERWRDAVAELTKLLDGYQEWRDSIPETLQDSATAERLDELLELRELVDQLGEAELPKGFGRD